MSEPAPELLPLSDRKPEDDEIVTTVPHDDGNPRHEPETESENTADSDGEGTI